MNIPFINDMYEEKNICVNEFSSEFQSLIDTYVHFYVRQQCLIQFLIFLNMIY